MRDRRDLIAAFDRLRPRGEHAVLVTVVRVVGSAYRRPGARMLLAPDGRHVGLVSGGCLEADLVERAVPVLESGRAITVTYDARSDEDLIFGLGLGCEGKIELLIERVPERHDGGHLAVLSRCLEAREPLALASVYRSSGDPAPGAHWWRTESGRAAGDVHEDRVVQALERAAEAALASGRHQNVTVDGAQGPVEALVEALLPFPKLVILGAGPDAQPVARLAVELGFDVTAVDHRPAAARSESFPGAARIVVCEPERLGATIEVGPDAFVLVMSHSYVHDRAYLRQLVVRPPRYLGVLGPRRRTERILAELAREGIVLDDSARTCLHAPVGLDLGAETPEEIALSILAEIQAEIAGRAGGRLRDRNAPIHGDGGGA